MKDRIDGWTQQDEDWTFGLNGYDRCWIGDESPTLEEQRLILHLYRGLAEGLHGDILVPKGPPPTPDAIRAAIDGLLEDVVVPEGLAGAITIIK